jgi:hypothetical protein
MIDQGASKERNVMLLNAIIDRARDGVRSAETELVLAVRHLMPLQVGDKHLITAGLEGSFEKLNRARRSVAGLQRMLSRL